MCSQTKNFEITSWDTKINIKTVHQLLVEAKVPSYLVYIIKIALIPTLTVSFYSTRYECIEDLRRQKKVSPEEIKLIEEVFSLH